jgi:heptaprenyl diphosphate synthase
MEICAGEVRQQAIRYRYTTDMAEYMGRIRAKTATLLAASCEIGALLAGVNSAQRKALENYGLLLGLSFQIADDVLDYTGSEGEVGKPTGHDIADGFATLPLLLAREDKNRADRLKTILQDGRRLNVDEARRVVDEVIAGGGPNLALAVAREYATTARSQLDAIEPGEARSALAALTDYVVSRKL